MNTFKSYLLILFVVLFSVGTITSVSAKETKSKSKYLVKTKVPKRPAGQKHVLGLTTPKMEKVRVGFIGLGMRGPGAVERFTQIPGVEIKALCDLHPDRVAKAQNILKKYGLPEAASYSGSYDAWKELCNRSDIDLVYIVTDWSTHAPMSIYAMEKGKHVAVEVPGAMTMDEIWKVINTAEKTQKHCMMLENCVYDNFELTTLNMIQKGVFGEVLYAEGAYIHQLEAFWDAYENDWRMKYNRKQRGDLYPTHGMGPACQALDIHRGDKMNVLVSMDSKAVSIPNFLEKKFNEKVADFQNGQNTMTFIRTEKGKTIHIQHDVATPRPYSRMYNVAGTNGYASKYPRQGYALQGNTLENAAPDLFKLDAHSFMPDEARRNLMEKYKSPILTEEMQETANKLGAIAHGGMDFIMDYRLIYCLRKGLPLDMDVYDLEEWSCLVPLSKISLENGYAPVEVPDFTRGHWNDIQGYRQALAK